MKDLDEFDFEAALAKPRRAGQKLAGRRQADKKKLADSDRRRIKSTGRTEQMNLRCRPDWKAEIYAFAEKEGLLPIEVLERAWAALKGAP